jgi:hypothetical protein
MLTNKNILSLLDANVSQSEIAKQCGVSRQCISSRVQRARWKLWHGRAIDKEILVLDDTCEVLIYNRFSKVIAKSIIDIEDLDLVKPYTWSLYTGGYIRSAKLRTSMHRFLMSPIPDGMQVDHINRIRLDNRRSNLRIVTRSENMKNTGTRPKRSDYGLSLEKAWWQT